MQTSKTLTAALSAFLFLQSWSAEVVWRPVNMNSKCESLDDLYSLHPELKGAKTPEKMAAAMRVSHPDAKAESFLDFSAAIEASQGGPSAPHKIPKAYTKTNSVMVHWGGRDDFDGFLLYTDELCRALYKKASE